MNYLCQYVKSKKFFVMSNVSKDWSTYITNKTEVSRGKEFFRVIQEIEIL